MGKRCLGHDLRANLPIIVRMNVRFRRGGRMELPQPLLPLLLVLLGIVSVCHPRDEVSFSVRAQQAVKLGLKRDWLRVVNVQCLEAPFALFDRRPAQVIVNSVDVLAALQHAALVDLGQE